MKRVACQIVDELAGLLRRAGIAPERHPVFLSRRDDGSRHLEVAADDRFELVVTERGSIISRIRFQDRKALLYELVKDATFTEAQTFELAHRVEGQDSRRLLFDRQITLMGRIASDWRQRLSWEVAEILVRTPFRDDGT
jgi:hypothetical protein